MYTLLKKELQYYLNNPIGFIVIILFSLFANFLFLKDLFVSGSASMKPFFGTLPWLLFIFIPALSMRMFSEERKTNTIEVLLTLPLSESKIVLAKYICVVLLSGIALLLTALIPLSLAFYSQLYIPEVIVGYLGSMLLVSAFTGISLYFSNITKNQIVAFLASTLTLFCLLGMSTESFTSFLPKYIQDALSIFGLLNHYLNFIKGLIDLRSVIYFTSMTFLSLFITTIDLKKKT